MRYISCCERVRRDLNCLRNCSKMVERSLFVIIDLLLEAKFIVLNFIWRVGDDFKKKISSFRKNFILFLLHLTFSCYYCSIDLKRKSKHSRLRSDTSSLVFPSLDTKVKEYLCSGWVIFSSDKFRLFN